MRQKKQMIEGIWNTELLNIIIAIIYVQVYFAISPEKALELLQNINEVSYTSEQIKGIIELYNRIPVKSKALLFCRIGNPDKIPTLK